MNKMTKLFAAAAVLAVFPMLLLSAPEDQRVVPIPDSVDPPEKLDLSTKTALMQAKMNASSEALEGLVNGDFTKIGNAAKVLEAIALAAPRQYQDLHKLDAGEHLRREFLRLAQRLGDQAEQRNLDGAAYVHQHITATCIACHRQLRARRIPESASR